MAHCINIYIIKNVFFCIFMFILMLKTTDLIIIESNLLGTQKSRLFSCYNTYYNETDEGQEYPFINSFFQIPRYLSKMVLTRIRCAEHSSKLHQTISK